MTQSIHPVLTTNGPAVMSLVYSTFHHLVEASFGGGGVRMTICQGRDVFRTGHRIYLTSCCEAFTAFVLTKYDQHPKHNVRGRTV